MERAIAYIRVSTDRQVKDGTSLDTQRRRVQEYAEMKGYELDRLFVEEGENAKTDNRPTLQELLTYVRQNHKRIDVLVFPKVDRFARYAADYHFLKRLLNDRGIRIESTDERFDDSPSGRYFESILAATAQFDNDIRSERAKGGMYEAVLAGRWLWSVPVGYRRVQVNDKATIEPDPLTGPFISRAFRMLAKEGQTPKDVRRWLASKAVRIGRSQFYRMIFNRAYIGVIEGFGLTERATPPFLPLVSEAIFYAAQTAVKPRRGPRSYQRDREDFPLRGTLKCCVCGKLLTAGWARGRNRSYPYYRCKHCPRINLPRAVVNKEFIDALLETKRLYSFTVEVQKELVRLWHDERATDIARATRLEKEIVDFRELQKAIVLKNAQGVIPDSLAREQIDELSHNLSERQIKLAECKAVSASIEKALIFANSFLARLELYWEESNLQSKKHIQRFFFPTGATINDEAQIRTPKIPLPAGSAVRLQADLSHLAPPASRSSNPVAPKQRNRKTNAS